MGKNYVDIEDDQGRTLRYRKHVNGRGLIANGAKVHASALVEAGVPVAFIDFFNHPFENQARSLALLGALIGRGEQSAAFNAFKKARLDAISAEAKLAHAATQAEALSFLSEAEKLALLEDRRLVEAFAKLPA